MEITSLSNEKVKYIKSLNEKKFRQKYNAFYIEGVKVVSELLDIYKEKAINIEFIAYSLNLLKKVNGYREVLEKVKKSGIEVIEIENNIFEKVVETVTTQGILCVVKIKDISLNDIDVSKNILILDKVQDSGNLGTIIRTANAFGVSNIICTKGTTDVYSQKVVRSTMLSILKTSIVYVDNIDEMFKFLKENDYLILATSLKESSYLESKSFDKKCAIVLGNEANGVDAEILKKSDKIIKIKINDEVESLNVAVAASILLYEQFKNNKK
ncbi:MAG: RNA methyltransferase [Clostridia bacterium]|nr:RNA methyltransferase [Clostridia bacterium]